MEARANLVLVFAITAGDTDYVSPARKPVFWVGDRINLWMYIFNGFG